LRDLTRYAGAVGDLGRPVIHVRATVVFGNEHSGQAQLRFADRVSR